LFLNINFQNAANIHMVKYTRGVSKILCAENRPLPVRAEVIQTIQSRANSDGIVEKQARFMAGDPVRVRRGLLKDLEGILERSVSDEERVIVLLKLVNYNMRATLHWTEVEKLHAA
jgi:transcription antitermination factor NusG